MKEVQVGSIGFVDNHVALVAEGGGEEEEGRGEKAKEEGGERIAAKEIPARFPGFRAPFGKGRLIQWHDRPRGGRE